MPTLSPRLVIAGTHSGVGKTTVATGLVAALGARGTRVAAAKVGPDFVDPGYHTLAAGHPSRNLDPWLCGEEAIGPLAARAGTGSEVLVIEGVMGLFDGAGWPSDGGPRDLGSTAHVARLLDAPVVLVVDAAALSGSVAALVHGYSTLDPAVRVAGVILNRVGTDSHADLLRSALEPLGLPVLGELRRDDALVWRDRHLGLVPVVEDPERVARSLDRLAAAVRTSCDIDGLVALARSAATLEVGPVALPEAVVGGASGERPRIALAGGPAFSFTYQDNLEALEAAGAELVPFDPLTEPSLPDGVDGLVAGGGFPEVFAPALADNERLLEDVARRVRSGLVTWAECGGLLWLARSLDGHRLCGVVDADCRMTEQLTLGYRHAVTQARSPLGPTGTELRGHEFHYSTVDPPGPALELTGRRQHRTRAGFASPTLLVSYLHMHLGAAPARAEAFVRAVGGRPS